MAADGAAHARTLRLERRLAYLEARVAQLEAERREGGPQRLLAEIAAKLGVGEQNPPSPPPPPAARPQTSGVPSPPMTSLQEEAPAFVPAFSPRFRF